MSSGMTCKGFSGLIALGAMASMWSCQNQSGTDTGSAFGPTSFSKAVDFDQEDLDAAAESNTGLVKFLLTDAPAPEIDALRVTLDEVSVHCNKNEDVENWLAFEMPPQTTFDLLRLRDGELGLLGIRALPPGECQQIRLHVTSAEVEKGGVVTPATVPSEYYKIHANFLVTNGAGSVITLDFDAAESLKCQADDCSEYKLEPSIVVVDQKDISR